MMKVDVHRIPMNAPDDVSGLSILIDRGKICAQNIVAIIGKTEGNGLVSDFTRGFATCTARTMISEKTGIPKERVDEKVAFVFSGGCEGVMSPHMTVFVRETVAGQQVGDKRLAIGVGFTRDFLPEEIGTMVQVRETAKAVGNAIKESEIEASEDVHFVQVKCPLLNMSTIGEARKRGGQLVTTDPLLSMSYSNGASALGVALALGEVAESDLDDEVICKDLDLRSNIASASSGWEKRKSDIIVLGNSRNSASELVIGHGLMKDCIDAEAVKNALRSAGLQFRCCPSSADLDKVVAVFCKGFQDVRTWTVRGRRITIPTDADFGMRVGDAIESSVIASVIGDPMVYVSGGPDFHQGGVVAAIIRR